MNCVIKTIQRSRRIDIDTYNPKTVPFPLSHDSLKSPHMTPDAPCDCGAVVPTMW